MLGGELGAHGKKFLNMAGVILRVKGYIEERSQSAQFNEISEFAQGMRGGG